MQSLTHPTAVKVTRRHLLKVATVSAGMYGAPAFVRAQTKTITTTGYGGIYEKHYRPNVIEPWEKKTGYKVNVITTGGADQ